MHAACDVCQIMKDIRRRSRWMTWNYFVVPTFTIMVRYWRLLMLPAELICNQQSRRRRGKMPMLEKCTPMITCLLSAIVVLVVVMIMVMVLVPLTA